MIRSATRAFLRSAASASSSQARASPPFAPIGGAGMFSATTARQAEGRVT